MRFPLEDPTGGHVAPFEWAAKAVAGACVFLAAMLAAGRSWIRREAKSVANEQLAAHEENENAHPKAIQKATAPVLEAIADLAREVRTMNLRLARLVTAHNLVMREAHPGGEVAEDDASGDSGDEMFALEDVPMNRRACDPDGFDPRPYRNRSGVRANR